MQVAPALRVTQTTPESIANECYSIFPVYEFFRTREAALSRGARINQLSHRTTLSDHTSRNVTTPNNDTLYSAAWLDLAKGPVTLTIPASQSRYFSIAILDIFTDNVGLISARQNSQNKQEFTIVGPGVRVTSAKRPTTIRVPTNDAWLILRVGVRSSDDLHGARAFQAAVRLNGEVSSSRVTEAAILNPVEPKDFWAAVLSRGPVGQEKLKQLRSSDELFSTTDWKQCQMSLPNDLAARWLSEGRRIDGWTYVPDHIGSARSSARYRAAVAYRGLGALPITESIYAIAEQAEDGQRLNGAKGYRIRIPANVPVSALGFWSLSLYEPASDGKLFFSDNALGRYAISGSTPSLRREADGSIIVAIQHNPPHEGASNWLPSPKGPFSLVFRAYLPHEEILDGSFTIPPLTEILPR